MSTLRIDPFYLTKGTLVEVQLQAKNLKGWSTLSPVNTAGAVVEQEPTVVPGLANVSASTDDTQVSVTWSALTTTEDQGGPTAPVISYNLRWDNGTNQVDTVNLVGISPLSLATSFTATADVVPGTLYYLRVRAKNKYGWGADSTPLAVYAAAKPEAPSAPTSSKQSINMRISWPMPDVNGLAATEYQILIMQKDGTYTESAQCDGSDSTVVSNRYCDVPMVHLRQSPYAMVLNDPVKAKVRAYNLIGWSPYSAETTSYALISTEPRQPPTAPQEGSNTDDTQLHVTWAALTGDNTGNEPITFYEVQWDMGLGTWALFKFENAASPTYQHTQTSGVTSGTDYQFRYRASNVHGTGDYSPVSTIKAATVPAQLGAATTSTDGTTVTISWPATTNERGASVTEYRIKIKQSDGSFSESSSCSGTAPLIISSRSCTIAESELKASPYSLSTGNLVVAVVEAKNIKGYSTPSAENTSGANLS